MGGWVLWVKEHVRTKTQGFPQKRCTDCCKLALFLRRQRLIFSNALQSLQFLTSVGFNNWGVNRSIFRVWGNRQLPLETSCSYFLQMLSRHPFIDGCRFPLVLQLTETTVRFVSALAFLQRVWIYPVSMATRQTNLWGPKTTADSLKCTEYLFVSNYSHMIERTVTGLKGVHVPVRQNNSRLKHTRQMRLASYFSAVRTTELNQFNNFI